MSRIRPWLPALGVGLACPQRPQLTLAEALALPPEEAAQKQIEAFEDMKEAWRVGYKLWLNGCTCQAAGRPFDRDAANAIQASLRAIMCSARSDMNVLDERTNLTGLS